MESGILNTNTNALDIIRRCYTEGADIALKDGKPSITRNQPSPELLAELKEHREAIISKLQEHCIGETDPVLRTTRRYVTAPDCFAKGACGCLGPCANFYRQLPCDNRKVRR